MLNVYSRARDGETLLSRSFRAKEFACKDGTDPLFVDSELVQVLQAIRDHFGAPVVITSGCCDPICRNRLKRPCKIKTKASPNSSDKKRVFYRLDRFSYICSQRIPICTNCQKAKHTKFALFPAYIIFAGRG